jgi:hypothetical protein
LAANVSSFLETILMMGLLLLKEIQNFILPDLNKIMKTQFFTKIGERKGIKLIKIYLVWIY